MLRPHYRAAIAAAAAACAAGTATPSHVARAHSSAAAAAALRAAAPRAAVCAPPSPLGPRLVALPRRHAHTDADPTASPPPPPPRTPPPLGSADAGLPASLYEVLGVAPDADADADSGHHRLCSHHHMPFVPPSRAPTV